MHFAPSTLLTRPPFPARPPPPLPACLLARPPPQVRSLGFDKPTVIQSQAWPIATAGRDLIAIASTGSGKTAGYVVPALEHIRTAMRRLVEGGGSGAPLCAARGAGAGADARAGAADPGGGDALWAAVGLAQCVSGGPSCCAPGEGLQTGSRSRRRQCALGGCQGCALRESELLVGGAAQS